MTIAGLLLLWLLVGAVVGMPFGSLARAGEARWNRSRKVYPGIGPLSSLPTKRANGKGGGEDS